MGPRRTEYGEELGEPVVKVYEVPSRKSSSTNGLRGMDRIPIVLQVTKAPFPNAEYGFGDSVDGLGIVVTG
jgi:hypothetical protein